MERSYPSTILQYENNGHADVDVATTYAPRRIDELLYQSFRVQTRDTRFYFRVDPENPSTAFSWRHEKLVNMWEPT
jgi:hypothetical protein